MFINQKRVFFGGNKHQNHSEHTKDYGNNYFFTVKSLWCENSILSLSAPQDFTSVVRTRSRLRVWGWEEFIFSGIFNFFFSWFYEKVQSVG